MRLGISLSLTQQFGGFSPASLFNLAEPGVWYDPSDLTTLFQDTAGTTPVTTPGQTVALALDKSKGLVLGPELVTNGTFVANSSAGWTLNTWTVANNRLEKTAGDTLRASGTLTSALVSGRYYRVTLDASNFTTGCNALLRTGVGGTSSTAYSIPSGSATRSFVLQATDAHTVIQFFPLSTGFSGTIDNISVRELPGNHATQATAASRPTYGIVPATGRRNLLVNTPFAGAVAGSPGAIPTSWTLDINNASIATPSADVIEISAVAQRTVFRQSFSVAAGEVRTFSCNVEVVSGTIVFNQIFDMTNFAGPTYTYFVNGAPVTSTTTIPVGSHVLQVTIVNDATLRTIGARIGVGVVSNSTAVVRYNEPQFEAGPTATAYQRVTTAFDVTEAGVPSLSYLFFDGVDDSLVTPTITPNTDKMQVFAGVRKLSDANAAQVCELSASVSSNAGSFFLFAPPAATPTLAFASKGTVQATATASGFPAPTTRVLTGLGDISGGLATIRVNGTLANQTTTGQGTGNYLAYPLYIGRRGGTTLPFNGQIYSLITRFGANLDDNTISNTETWVNGKTGAY